MPMYFPDLESVQSCVNSMRRNKGDKQYKGIYPDVEDQLLEARMQLAEYFRTVWDDEIQALEIENAVTESNYDEVMGKAMMRPFMDKLPGF